MRRSIATVSMSGTLPEKLEAIAAARFDGVEIFENDLTFFSGSPRQVRRTAHDLGLTIDLFQPFRDMEGVTDAQVRRNLDRAERKFDIMGELDASLMLVCSNATKEAIDDDERSAAQLYAMAELAAKRGIKLGFEALAWSTHINTFDRAWKVVQKANHPHLGLIVDSFHTLALPYDWSGLSSLPGDKIFFAQLADAPRLDMATLMLSRHHRNLPGQGELDVAGFVSALLKTGYTGTLSLEIFNDELRAAPPRQTARDAFRSLQFVEEQVRRLDEERAATTGAAVPRRRVELFDPPPAARLDGVAFVEFAVDHATRKKLAAELGSLGFRKIGKHIAKDVELYGQGDVRFVLNAEGESAAHSYFLLHGPSVCALAFEVDDPLTALGRAEAYGCTRFEGRVGPNELSIPAIRSLDGMLIYFTQRRPDGKLSFEADFVFESPDSPVENPVSRIDHIAQALEEGTLDTFQLFYRTILDLQPETTWILPDPYGLVRSRALSERRRKVRFPLNIAGGRRTTTARSLHNYLGSGVHHIAFETDNILAVAQQLVESGASILPIPQNYYDDLGARFGLDDAILDQYRELNILYDRTEKGEFLQIYTVPFEGRFFFEIVQRINGYDLYGAANAPVRMAAVAQLQTTRSQDFTV